LRPPIRYILAAALLSMTSTSLVAELQWNPAASTHNGTAFSQLSTGVGSVQFGFPSASNPAGAGQTANGVFVFGFATSTNVPPSVTESDLSASPLTAGTQLTLVFDKAETDRISFMAMVGDASDPSNVGFKQLSSTQIEIRGTVVDPVASESNSPDNLGAIFGLVAVLADDTNPIDLKGTVFVTDMHWNDVSPPDFSELPQTADDINGMAAGIAAAGISATDVSGTARFTAFMQESFFEFARENGVDVTGESCLGYRAYVELNGSDDGFTKLNDPVDQPAELTTFDADGDGNPDPMWQYRITNSTWSRQVLAFGKAAQTTKPGDFDTDGDVDFNDFLVFAAGFGKTSSDSDFNATLDLSNNAIVDFDDFLIFASNFGT
jgi:hypothetical protein